MTKIESLSLAVKEQEKAEVLCLLEKILIALDENDMAIPAIKIAEAVDVLKSPDGASEFPPPC